MNTRGPSTSKLATFLSDPGRPEETLRYHELQGFLFAVAAAPDLVPPSEWIPEVFGGREPDFGTGDEAQRILTELMALYNSINASMLDRRATLPPDCQFLDDVLANLAEDAPMSLWSRGFLRGHQWLEESWDPYIPEEIDEEFGLQLMTLSFFASPDLAAAFAKEMGRTDVGEAASLLRDVFPDALAEYAHLGRSIGQVLAEHGGTGEPRAQTKVGRNAPCPCGSGRKYKHCCGAA